VAEVTTHEIVVPVGVVRSRSAFLRDFAALFADRKTKGKYVCYHEDQLVAINEDYFALLREFYARNIPENASLVVQVTPEAERDERVFFEEAELPEPCRSS